MKVSGFTFIRNAVKNDYPIVEAIMSILPLCDEFVVVVGNSEDGTRKLIERLNSPIIKIIDSVWDDSLKEGGTVFARETDKAFNAISPHADWAFYIQGDEIIHEKYHSVIKKEMEINLKDPNVEGLLFKYLHFYGSYDFIGSSRRWYRREIRLMKNIKGIHAYRDAQGFRLNDRKISVKLIDAYVYHYGWAKPKNDLNKKIRNFNKFYHTEDWFSENLPESFDFNYENADKLVEFSGTHPKVMHNRIEATRWNINFKTSSLKNKMSFRRKLLQKIEELTGWRIGEYQNYKIVKS